MPTTSLPLERVSSRVAARSLSGRQPRTRQSRSNNSISIHIYELIQSDTHTKRRTRMKPHNTHTSLYMGEHHAHVYGIYICHTYIFIYIHVYGFVYYVACVCACGCVCVRFVCLCVCLFCPSVFIILLGVLFGGVGHMIACWVVVRSARQNTHTHIYLYSKTHVWWRVFQFICTLS